MSENSKPEPDIHEIPKKLLDDAPKSFIRIEAQAGGRDFFLTATCDEVQSAIEGADLDEFVPFEQVEIYLTDPEKRFLGVEYEISQISHRVKHIVGFGEVTETRWKGLLEAQVPMPPPPGVPSLPPGVTLPPGMNPPT